MSIRDSRSNFMNLKNVWFVKNYIILPGWKNAINQLNLLKQHSSCLLIHISTIYVIFWGIKIN